MSKTYAEMLEQAKAIHPNARVRLNEFTNCWDIIIRTQEEEFIGVAESWAGTAAERAYNKANFSHDNELYRWAWKNGLSTQPMELIAEQYNIIAESSRRVWEIVGSQLDKIGLPLIDGVLNPKDKEQVKQARKFHAEATKQVSEEFASRQEKLTELMNV
jgi:hypothetical protein